MSRRTKKSSPVRWALEYWALRLVVDALGLIPRQPRRYLAAVVGDLLYRSSSRLRGVAHRNLELALPGLPPADRDRIARSVFRSLSTQIAEFCGMHRWTRESASNFIRYDGLDRFLAAEARGRGVLVLTAHLGAWELSSFFHSLMGHPMSFVVRRLDNPRVAAFVDGIRSLHGNRTLDKDDFARGLLQAMARGETVGILMDTNMTPPQGVFVPFFGINACTASGLARVALHADPAVLPGFLLWDEASHSYRLHFGEELQLIRTGDREHDILANTALFTSTLERYIRANPEQWLWVHRRWKTRPPGEPSLY